MFTLKNIISQFKPEKKYFIFRFDIRANIIRRLIGYSYRIPRKELKVIIYKERTQSNGLKYVFDDTSPTYKSFISKLK